MIFSVVCLCYPPDIENQEDRWPCKKFQYLFAAGWTLLPHAKLRRHIGLPSSGKKTASPAEDKNGHGGQGQEQAL